ncbi:hypothetical protein AgCh_029087 [Apium graveolens]
MQVKAYLVEVLRKAEDKLLEGGITAHIAAPNGMVDSEVQDLYTNESLKTVMQICNRCLLEDPADRPSIKDVLWDLQFAAQIQDPEQ